MSEQETKPARILKVGDLRNMIEGVPNDRDVIIEIANVEEGTDLAQGGFVSADLETRCDGTERLYIFGDAEVNDGDPSED